MPKRKLFSREYRLEAVRQLELGEKSATTIVTEIGTRRNLLYKWQEQIKGNLIQVSVRATDVAGRVTTVTETVFAEFGRLAGSVRA